MHRINDFVFWLQLPARLLFLRRVSMATFKRILSRTTFVNHGLDHGASCVYSLFLIRIRNRLCYSPLPLLFSLLRSLLPSLYLSVRYYRMLALLCSLRCFLRYSITVALMWRIWARPTNVWSLTTNGEARWTCVVGLSGSVYWNITVVCWSLLSHTRSYFDKTFMTIIFDKLFLTKNVWRKFYDANVRRKLMAEIFDE